jgi:hypothetical protein
MFLVDAVSGCLNVVLRYMGPPQSAIWEHAMQCRPEIVVCRSAEGSTRIVAGAPPAAGFVLSYTH